MTIPSLGDLLPRRLVLVTGKGGVGKTTVVAALATHAAFTGKRPLIVELGHRASFRSVFAVEEIGYEPCSVAHGVWAMSMDLDAALPDYFAARLRSRKLARTIANNAVLKRLFAAMPAVGEVVALHKLRELHAEMRARQPRWDPLIVDLDATGHAAMFLELKQSVGALLGSGPMKRLVDDMADVFADPRRTAVCLVTTPAELPVSETIELYRRLADAQAVSFGPIFANRVPRTAEPLDSGALRSLELAARACDEREVLADLAFARPMIRATQRARAQLVRLRDSIPLPIVEIPELAVGRLGPADLARLGALASAPAGVRGAL